jgi:hypothetical protein
MNANSNNHPARPPVLTMQHGVHHSGRLVFDANPNLFIKLPPTAVNMLVTLFVAWERECDLSEDDRGWLTGKDVHETYQEQMKQKLQIDSVRKYVTRLINRLEREFEKLGLTLPSLVVRDDRGVHLTRPIIIKDLTGQWKPLDEARQAAWSPGQPLNVQPTAQSTRQLRAE